MAIKVSGTTIIDDGRNFSNVGIITATTINASLVGDAFGLTGAGSTVADDTTTNQEFYPLFTDITSGTVTSSKVSTTKLTFNPSTGTLSSSLFTGNITGTASSISILQTSRTINGISFNGSSDIEANPLTGDYSNGNGARTVGTSGVTSGGSDGDSHYVF